MLKRLSVIFSLFLTACTNNIFTTSSQQQSNTSQPNAKVSSVDRSYFVGSWACEMNGGNIGSSNTVKLAQDGYANYVGTFTMPKEAPIFQYQLERVGTWSFANDMLSYQFSQSNFTRAHTFEMLKNIKTNKELNEEENATFANLSKQMQNANNRTFSLAVSNISDQSFVITQNLQGNARTGMCKRVAQ